MRLRFHPFQSQVRLGQSVILPAAMRFSICHSARRTHAKRAVRHNLTKRHQRSSCHSFLPSRFVLVSFCDTPPVFRVLWACNGFALESAAPCLVRVVNCSLDRPCVTQDEIVTSKAVSYTHLRAHETDSYLVCRLLLEKKKKKYSYKQKKKKKKTKQKNKTNKKKNK